MGCNNCACSSVDPNEEQVKDQNNKMELEKIASQYKKKQSNKLSNDHIEKHYNHKGIKGVKNHSKKLDEENELLIEEHYIRDDEKDVLSFTKQGIVNFMKKIENESKWITTNEKEDLTVQICNEGTDLTKDFILAKHIYRMKKSLFKEKFSLKRLHHIIYNPEERIKFDSCVKSFSRYFGSDESNVYRLGCYSPFFLISERDSVEKRVAFMHENIFYSFASSIDDKFIQPHENFVRMFYFVDSLIFQETKDLYIFTGYSQLDIKMHIPQWVINITGPWKMRQWYQSLEAHLEKLSNEEIESQFGLKEYEVEHFNTEISVTISERKLSQSEIEIKTGDEEEFELQLKGRLTTSI